MEDKETLTALYTNQLVVPAHPRKHGYREGLGHSGVVYLFV